MESTNTSHAMDGVLFTNMLRAGAMNLRSHVQAINDLNVFPIPDGDTGDNMMLTILGGVDTLTGETRSIGEASRQAANGMLLSARGNSGVILSQLFDGIAEGFSGIDQANEEQVGAAMRLGVQHAYNAVLGPTEGTILTVARKASEYAASQAAPDLSGYFDNYLSEARRVLSRTPDMLPVLKKAGVVDSGGAGLVYIVEGMQKCVAGELDPAGYRPMAAAAGQDIDVDLFTEDSELAYGYCTELLLRLQRSKTDVEAFRVATLTDYLQTIGDSVAAFKTGSAVKLHVHTKTPDKVLHFCQQYGEFLKVKIENMSLQHNNTLPGETAEAPEQEPKEYGIVAVCSGEGIRQLFLDRGADVTVDGGQSMNPSAEAFLKAFRQVNARTIFVLPNNGNVILSARQAAALYPQADVRVLKSRTIGDGYTALAMFDPEGADADALEQELNEAMEGVVTAQVSRCVRDSELEGAAVHAGDYIGFVGDTLLASSENRLQALCASLERLNPGRYAICILISGAGVDAGEASQAESFLNTRYPGREVYVIDGRQELYDYILILE